MTWVEATAPVVILLPMTILFGPDEVKLGTPNFALPAVRGTIAQWRTGLPEAE